MDAKRKRDAGVGELESLRGVNVGGVRDKDAAECDKAHCPCCMIGPIGSLSLAWHAWDDP